MAGRRRESGRQVLAEPESRGRPYHTAVVHHNASAPVISGGHPLAGRRGSGGKAFLKCGLEVQQVRLYKPHCCGRVIHFEWNSEVAGFCLFNRPYEIG
jgi:hypothetical protein